MSLLLGSTRWAWGLVSFLLSKKRTLAFTGERHTSETLYRVRSLRPTSTGPFNCQPPHPAPLPRPSSILDFFAMALASRCCARLVARSSFSLVPKTAALPVMNRRHNSIAAVDPKIASIVDQISGLTLLQTAELVSSLKVNSRPPRPVRPAAHP